MSRPWTRSMPNQPEEVYGTQTSNNFTQGQSSQQDSEAALSQVCRLFEQSQQQHQEMMNHVINMGNHREPYQPHSKLSELQKTRPSTFAHTDRPLEADDWLRDIERKLIIAQCSDHEKVPYAPTTSLEQLQHGGRTSYTCIPVNITSPGRSLRKAFVGHTYPGAS